MIYATTGYLDHTCDNWTGLVVDDYSAVMPVAWRTKFGIRYAYDVPFIQQLGLFTARTDMSLDPILNALYGYCKYGDYSFNFLNVPGVGHRRNNFILSLNEKYEVLASKFSSDAVQNIRKAGSQGLKFTAGTVDEAVDAYREMYSRRLKNVSRRQYANFSELASKLFVQDKAVVRKVVNSKNDLLSIVLLLKDGRRLYNIMNTTTAAGRENESNYYLLSEVWKEFQQSGLLFDFEGSDIPGVANFYSRFGPVNQPYTTVHFNRLPLPLRWFKR